MVERAVGIAAANASVSGWVAIALRLFPLGCADSEATNKCQRELANAKSALTPAESAYSAVLERERKNLDECRKAASSSSSNSTSLASPTSPSPPKKTSEESFSLIKNVRASNNWAAVIQSGEQFVVEFPKHRLKKKVESLFREAKEAEKKQEKAEKKKQEEEALEASLADVAMPVIFAEIGKYKGKTISRWLNCHRPREKNAPAFKFSMSCKPENGSFGDIVIGLDDAHLKELANYWKDGFAQVHLKFRILGRRPFGTGVLGKLVEILEAKRPEGE